METAAPAADAPLVDERVVTTYDTVLEAEMAKGCLESAGIPARIVGDGAIGAATELSRAFGGVKLLVDASSFEAARAVLASLDAPRAEPEGAVDDAADRDAVRALKLAMLGMVLLPVLAHLWSAFLLARVWSRRRNLSAYARRQAIGAAVVDAMVLAIAASLTWVIVFASP